MENLKSQISFQLSFHETLLQIKKNTEKYKLLTLQKTFSFGNQIQARGFEKCCRRYIHPAAVVFLARDRRTFSLSLTIEGVINQ